MLLRYLNCIVNFKHFERTQTGNAFFKRTVTRLSSSVC